LTSVTRYSAWAFVGRSTGASNAITGVRPSEGHPGDRVDRPGSVQTEPVY